MESKRKLDSEYDSSVNENNKRMCFIQFSDNKKRNVATSEYSGDNKTNNAVAAAAPADDEEDTDFLKIIDNVVKENGQTLLTANIENQNQNQNSITGIDIEKLKSIHYIGSAKEDAVAAAVDDDDEDDSKALVLANNLNTNDDACSNVSDDLAVLEKQISLYDKFDVVVLKMSDYNKDYGEELKHIKSFFKPEQINQNDDSITALFKNELISKADTFNYNRDSLILKIDFPKGFLNYMCDAANESPNNCVNINEYNLIKYEEAMAAKKLTKKLQDDDGDNNKTEVVGGGSSSSSSSNLTRNKVAFKRNNKGENYSLPIRFCQVISTFGSNTESVKLLASCTGWFKGRIEKKTCVCKSSNKSFSSYFLRIDPYKSNTFINGIFRTDDYFQLSRGIYFVRPMEDVRFKYYTLNDSKERVCVIVKSFDVANDKEVLIEFKNFEFLLLNNMHFLLRASVGRIVDVDFITGAPLN